MICDARGSSRSCSKTATKFGLAVILDYTGLRYYICNRCKSHSTYSDFFTFYNTPEERNAALALAKLEAL